MLPVQSMHHDEHRPALRYHSQGSVSSVRISLQICYLGGLSAPPLFEAIFFPKGCSLTFFGAHSLWNFQNGGILWRSTCVTQPLHWDPPASLPYIISHSYWLQQIPWQLKHYFKSELCVTHARQSARCNSQLALTRCKKSDCIWMCHSFINPAFTSSKGDMGLCITYPRLPIP